MPNRFSSFSLTTPATIDCRSTDEVEIQITALAGGDTITVTRSLDNVTFFNQMVAGPIAANTLYTEQAGGYIKFTKTGSASTPTITIREKVSGNFRPAQPPITVG